jgi:hypothetical protein
LIEEGVVGTAREILRQRTVQLRLGIGVTLVVVFLIGLFVGRATVSTTSPLHYSGTLTGTVDQIQSDQSSLCLEPSGGGAQVCENLMIQPGGHIAVGQKIKVAIGWIDTGGGSREEVLILLDPPPHL